MTTNIDIDQEKLMELMALKNYKTKKEAVNSVIDEYLKILARRELLKMRGKDVWEGNLDEMRRD